MGVNIMKHCLSVGLLMLLFLPHPLNCPHPDGEKPAHDPVTLGDAPPAFSNDDVSSFLKRLKNLKSIMDVENCDILTLHMVPCNWRRTLCCSMRLGFSLGDHILHKAAQQSLGYRSQCML